MPYDAFTAGIEPGGLRSQEEIRILLCYLLTSVNSPLSQQEILESLQGAGLANYFELNDALSGLTEKGILLCDKAGNYSAGPSAVGIARQLDTALPAAVREKAVAAATELLAFARNERENKVEVHKLEKGYEVCCHISGGTSDLMSFTLLLADHRQAEMVKRNFHRSPERVYRMLLALVSGDTDLAADLLKK